MEINFDAIFPTGVRVLIGHDKGVAAREAFNVDILDAEKQTVVFVMPKSLRTITPSFVQGLFAESVHKLGEKEFYQHYQFSGPGHIFADIKAGIDRALTSRHLAGV